ncbi:NAD-dependent epimerase/dehydratase family protein [Mycolicibacterium sp. P1-5]|uniref:NAD-dependent epimerase/dehydratase family protein n=1 Tax=Mycolicibacterium sp. P1-5 TaxID=2024617 RepID=UPI0011EFAF2B|nr:NAD-dependent epimerase/dehydratase family protein [Mycolicibacterium sp. P1-5]KAA0109846.1 NAD-dependent epimerase/dehydratase family protein [Mycolicibacterium sp. P1-5]
MPVKIVVGAGGTGVATAELLAAQGHRVRLITRRGSGPSHPLIDRLPLDAAQTGALVPVMEGASTIFNCAAPPYDQWHTHSSALASAILQAAITSRVDYVMLGNLYGYGSVDVPMTENLPLQPQTRKGILRANIWAEAKAAHDAGRIRVTEVRASDFIGRGATSVFTQMVAPRIVARKSVWFPADLDADHSWTSTVDTARALIATSVGDRAWGRPWHAPTNAPISVRQLSLAFAECANVPAPTLHRMPGWVLRAAGLLSPVVRELPEMQYQLRKPFVLDSSRMQHEFGLTPTPLAEILSEGLFDGTPRTSLRA